MVHKSESEGTHAGTRRQKREETGAAYKTRHRLGRLGPATYTVPRAAPSSNANRVDRGERRSLSGAAALDHCHNQTWIPPQAIS